MGAVTYPDASVSELLKSSFVCFKVNTLEPSAASELFRRFRHLWPPDLVFLDPTGALLRRQVGYLPPAEFVAVLQVVRGQTAMVYRKWDDALAAFTTGAAEPTMRPEALFWAGVAAYKLAGGNRGVLRRHWQAIRREFPESPWWTRAEASYGTPEPGEEETALPE